MALIAVKQTTMISASITAYSTAVGPSSDFKKCFTWVKNRFIERPPIAVSRPGAHLRRRADGTNGNENTHVASPEPAHIDGKSHHRDSSMRDGACRASRAENLSQIPR